MADDVLSAGVSYDTFLKQARVACYPAILELSADGAWLRLNNRVGMGFVTRRAWLERQKWVCDHISQMSRLHDLMSDHAH